MLRLRSAWRMGDEPSVLAAALQIWPTSADGDASTAMNSGELQKLTCGPRNRRKLSYETPTTHANVSTDTCGARRSVSSAITADTYNAMGGR